MAIELTRHLLAEDVAVLSKMQTDKFIARLKAYGKKSGVMTQEELDCIDCPKIEDIRYKTYLNKIYTQ